MNGPFKPPRPNQRRLRVYAFDPSLSTRTDTAMMNQVVVEVPWEEIEPNAGIVGEYLEVIDIDPASGRAYPPVNLNDPYLLAQDGLEPSEGNPQFHQQMVYAVAMRTIRNFERALGRKALWSGYRPGEVARERKAGEEKNGSPETSEQEEILRTGYRERFVQRLRIYPHAMREANAYYSPEKKALLFGYFPASASDPGQHYPGGIVFTCLSHDVIAHETSHALLDGMHRRFIERSNEDSLAFHEAFADIVALFQHFSLSEVLHHQISKTRGDLQSQNLLGQLAQEFGQATGAHGALRDALGVTDDNGVWHPRQPDPLELSRTYEPHARGALLVAAVFDAFLSIYKGRIADLLRIATSGSGVLPQGEISPDLVKRLADEAAKSAQHVCTMCIRALDYLPPVDITFGDYLRALITADYDLIPDDPRSYRVAFIQSFRRYGIYPRGVRNMSDEALRWRTPEQLGFTNDALLNFSDKLKVRLTKFANEWRLSGGKVESANHADAMLSSKRKPGTTVEVNDFPSNDHETQRTFREAVFHRAVRMRIDLHNWLSQPNVSNDVLRQLLGIDMSIGQDGKKGVFEVHSLRPTRRVGPDGNILLNMVIEVTQRKPIWINEDGTNTAPEGRKSSEPDFWFRGGATLIVDLESNEIRYVIVKDICSVARLQRQRDFLSGKFMDRLGVTADAEAALRMSYFGCHGQPAEPFALLHRSAPHDGVVRARLDCARAETIANESNGGQS